MRVLIVEDDPARIKKFFQNLIGVPIDVTDSPETAIALVRGLSYDRIYLDHDLHPYHYGSEKAPDSETGFAVAQFLARHPQCNPSVRIIIHSLNESGSDRMYRELKANRRQVLKVPFAWVK